MRTAHRVRIAGGAQAYAMCAVDALGIARMVGTDVRIDSVDSRTGAPIVVIVGEAGARWSPEGAVVYVGRAGSADDLCCSYLNFFTDHASATAWALARPEVNGTILVQPTALALGEAIFGAILRSG